MRLLKHPETRVGAILRIASEDRVNLHLLEGGLQQTVRVLGPNMPMIDCRMENTLSQDIGAFTKAKSPWHTPSDVYDARLRAMLGVDLANLISSEF